MTEKTETNTRKPEKEEFKDHGVISAGPEAHRNEGAKPGDARDPVKDKDADLARKD